MGESGASDKDIASLFNNLYGKMNGVFEDYGEGKPVSRSVVDVVSTTIINLVNTRKNRVLEFLLCGENHSEDYGQSAVNICVLSVVVSLYLNLPEQKVRNIACGALLHDSGMMKIPREIIEKKGSLTPDEVKIIQSHPYYSYKLIVTDLMYSEEVGQIAYQHHERWDGSGYPKNKRDRAIELGARIIAVVDAYEAMISRKNYRNSMIGYNAMKTLLEDNARRFDPAVLKAFIQSVGIYPVGSIVLLSDTAIARVIEGHYESPLRPKIRILVDSAGKTYPDKTGEVIDLLMNRSLFIIRAIDPREIQ